eukprot:1156115-Pelagomonas_calceolata.AAC.3
MTYLRNHIQQTTHGAAQFTVYEELKHMAARAGQAPTDPDRPISSFQTTVYAATSKLAASVLTYPSQGACIGSQLEPFFPGCRSRLQQRDFGRDLTYQNSWQVIQLTWKVREAGLVCVPSFTLWIIRCPTDDDDDDMCVYVCVRIGRAWSVKQHVSVTLRGGTVGAA